MFRPGSDSSQQDTSGTVLIPTRFVWPYGGRRAFVSGTFTGLVSLSISFCDIIFVLPFYTYNMKIGNIAIVVMYNILPGACMYC